VAVLSMSKQEFGRLDVLLRVSIDLFGPLTIDGGLVKRDREPGPPEQTRGGGQKVEEGVRATGSSSAQSTRFTLW
jgi:hypothetical protein